MLDHSHGLLGHLRLKGAIVDYLANNVLFFDNIHHTVCCDKGVLLREIWK